MAKLPIWAKDRYGKYIRFPTQLLRTFPDGRQGFTWVQIRNDEKIREMYFTFLPHFEDEDESDYNSRILLIEKPTRGE